VAEELPDWAAAYRRARDLVGAFEDRHGARAVSARHDDYLADLG
jgi:hypothetical protein